MFRSHQGALSRVSLLAVSSLFLATLSGCSGNSSSSRSSSGNQSVERVSGYVGAANITKASIQAVPITNQGQPEVEVGQDNEVSFAGVKTTSTPLGAYQAVIANERVGYPTALIASPVEGTTVLRCESVSGCDGVAYQGSVSLGDDFEYRALVTDIAANMAININWLTHVANAYAFTAYIDTTDDGINNPDTPQEGVYNRYRIDLANKQISAIFTVPDIISVQPIAPSQVAETTSLNLALQEQGIYLGALLSSIQRLKPAQQSYNQFLNGIIEEVNLRQASWLMKRADGQNGVALYDIFSAAQAMLSENIEFLRNQGRQVPAIADRVVATLASRVAVLENREGEYFPAPQIELSESAQNEFNRISEAKFFIQDLNDRFLNFTGQDADKPSFVDREYVGHVNRYINDVNVALRATSPDLMKSFATLRDGISYYASVLNGAPDANNPLAMAGRVQVERIQLPDNEGIEDETGVSDKLAILSGNEKLYLSLVGDDNTPRQPQDGQFFLFRLYIEGVLQEGDTRFEFNVGNDSNNRQTKPFIEVEYEEDFATLPPFTAAEPLTYQLIWPEVKSTKAGGETNYDLTQLFEAELVGISDPLQPDSEFRYNAKSLRYRLLTDGPELNSPADPEDVLRDSAEGVVTLTSSSWSLYYPENKWPSVSDYLTFRPGFDVTQQEDAVFRYFAATETIGDSVINYIDVLSLDNGGDVQQAQRYRQYPDSSDATLFAMQRCELDVADINNPVVGACDAPQDRKEPAPAGVTSAVVEQLAQKLARNIYPLAGRGHYRIAFPTAASGVVATLAQNRWVELKGRVVRLDAGLFEYQSGEETPEGADTSNEYLDIVLKDENGEPAILQRYRLLLIDGENERYNLQRCALILNSGNREVSGCDAQIEVSGEPSLQNMLSTLSDLSFIVPGRGSYQMQLNKQYDVVNDVEVASVTDFQANTAVTLDGALVAPISLGVDLLTVRLAADLHNRNSGQEQEKIGPLIIDANLKVLAEDAYDVALSFGYDYQYLVDIVPTGEDAQSFYIAYQTGLVGNGAPQEIGSFLVFRGGVSIAGGEPESIGVFATSIAEYELTEENTGETACAVANRDQNVNDCDTVAYIGYKGSLMAIVREERDDVFVARFFNGDFVILGQ